jgi:hypothetical protein
MEKITEAYTSANTVISRVSSVKILTKPEPGYPGVCLWQGEIFSPRHCPDKIFDLHINISSAYWGVPRNQSLLPVQ